jgi:hypothetical protein
MFSRYKTAIRSTMIFMRKAGSDSWYCESGCDSCPNLYDDCELSQSGMIGTCRKQNGSFVRCRCTCLSSWDCFWQLYDN